MAPARLVGLQNQVAVREMGPRRAMQVAWHRIEGPEASNASWLTYDPRLEDTLDLCSKRRGRQSPPSGQHPCSPFRSFLLGLGEVVAYFVKSKTDG